MTELHAALASRVADWRDAGYPDDHFPAIAEILSYTLEGEPPTQLTSRRKRRRSGSVARQAKGAWAK